MNHSERILSLDIETSPNLGYTWGKWEQNVIKIIRERQLLSFAYKWLGKPTRVLALCDFKSYKPGCDDKELLKPLHEILSQADFVIAQNGDQFDIKRINARFIFHGMAPPTPYKTIDTLKIAKARFGFNSNKLDDLGAYLGVGRKVKHEGFELWEKCMAGDMKAWAMMKLYNKQDVDLLERIYLKFRPWHKTHPNITNDEKVVRCPKCGSSELQSRGTACTQTMIYKRFQCMNCGGWCRGNRGEKFTRLNNA